MSFSPMTRAIAMFLLLSAGLAALLSLPSDTALHGAVSDADGPVADALVRWQGTSVCTHSDAQGRYRLPGPRRARPVTAARAGALIAAGSPRQPNLQLQPAPQDDNDDYAWIDPVPDARQPFNCGNCHLQIYDEWSASAHGKSATNRKFLHLFAGGDGAAPPAPTWNLMTEHPLGSCVCAGCHAPTLRAPDLG